MSRLFFTVQKTPIEEGYLSGKRFPNLEYLRVKRTFRKEIVPFQTTTTLFSGLKAFGFSGGNDTKKGGFSIIGRNPFDCLFPVFQGDQLRVFDSGLLPGLYIVGSYVLHFQTSSLFLSPGSESVWPLLQPPINYIIYAFDFIR